jgi:predicted nucleic acid-binding protein
MKDIDPEDTAFLALAMYLKCDGIWTNDNDFDKQDLVLVWKTHMLKKRI